MGETKGFKPMRMKWAYILRMVRGEYGTATAPDLLRYVSANKDLFPNGMSAKDAEWIAAHPEAFTDGEP